MTYLIHADVNVIRSAFMFAYATYDLKYNATKLTITTTYSLSIVSELLVDRQVIKRKMKSKSFVL